MRVVKQCGETWQEFGKNLARIWQEFGKIWQDLASLLLHAASCALVFRALSI